MKTLKTTTIITGVIVALFSLTTHATEKPKDKASKYEKLETINIASINNKVLEYQLIEDYLEEYTFETIGTSEPEKIMIYDENAELIYEGIADSKEASILKRSADFLMKYDNTSYYRLHN